MDLFHQQSSRNMAAIQVSRKCGEPIQVTERAASLPLQSPDGSALYVKDKPIMASENAAAQL
jgi:hypothetical protein